MLYHVVIMALCLITLSHSTKRTDERFWKLMNKLAKYDELDEVITKQSIGQLKQTFTNNIENEGEDEGEEMDSAINLMDKSEFLNTLNMAGSLSEDVGEEGVLNTVDEEGMLNTVDDVGEEGMLNTVDDISDLPETLDWRLADPPVLAPVMNQGPCGSCGIISGVRSAETRMAVASGNHRNYSIQQMMNCGKKEPKKRICVGTFSPNVWQLQRDLAYQVDAKDMPYLNSRNKCGTNYVKCQCNITTKENVFDDQLAYLGASLNPGKTEEGMIRALQAGPVTICYTAQKGQSARNVTKCGNGRSCNHANIIVGYDKEFFFVQNTYGKGWGPIGGYWNMNRKSECFSIAAWKWARYPVVWENYDKTGAIFTKDSLDYQLTLLSASDYDVANIGRAKKTCGLMGNQCVAIAETDSGEFKLVGALVSSSTSLSGYRGLYKKTQYVVRLYNEGAKQYLALNKNDDLTLSDKGSPFFVSNGRFVAYEKADYQVVQGPKLEKITGGSLAAKWTLKNCNLHNIHSGASLSIEPKKNYFVVKPNRSFDVMAASQRFDLGLHYSWKLATADGKLRLYAKKNTGQLISVPNPKKWAIFTWNARQIVGIKGEALRPDMSKVETKMHDPHNKQNVIQPRDCSLQALDDGTNLSVRNGSVEMSSKLAALGSGWTFEYEDI